MDLRVVGGVSGRKRSSWSVRLGVRRVFAITGGAQGRATSSHAGYSRWGVRFAVLRYVMECLMAEAAEAPGAAPHHAQGLGVFWTDPAAKITMTRS